MESNTHLYNAVVIAENAQSAFLAEGSRLHAVEEHVAARKKDQSSPQATLPLMRNAFQALMQFAQGKVPPAFTSAEKTVSLKPNEQEQLVEKIVNIYTHLPHNDRIALSSMIHHKQS